MLLLESNHDLEMLKVGPYPWSVKQRVMGRMGHLSNEVACRFLRDHLDSTTSTIILGHLSEHNNHPAIVESCAEKALGGREPVHAADCRRSAARHGVDSLREAIAMIARYTRPAMGRIFSDDNRFAQWLEVELASSEALAELGQVPVEAARALRAHAAFDVARIHAIEREVKHDVIAFTTAVAEKMAAAGAPTLLAGCTTALRRTMWSTRRRPWS